MLLKLLDYTSQNLRKVANIIIVALLFLAIILFVIYLRKAHPSDMYNYQQIGMNISYPYLHDDNNIYYFTGRSIASFDLKQHTTKLISSPKLLLPNNVSSVEYTKEGFFIKSDSQTKVDSLGKIIDKDKYNGFSDYLWYVPYNSSEPMYISVGVGSYYIDNSYVYYVVNGNAKTRSLLYRYSIKNNISTLLTSVEGVPRVVYAKNDYVFFLGGSSSNPSLYKYKNGKSDLVIDKPFNSQYATINSQFVQLDSNKAVYVRHSGDSSSLVMYDITNKTTRVVEKDFEGVLSQGSNGVVASNLLQGNIVFDYIPANSNILSHTINQPKGNVSSSTYSNGTIYFTDDKNNLYKVSDDVSKSTQNTLKTDISSDIPKKDGFYEYSQPTKAIPNYYVKITKGDYFYQINKFLKLVQASGVDSNQFNFIFTPGDSVTP